jgi:hypothetical protein
MDLQITFAELANWAVMKSCDAVFLQRPMTDSHVAILHLAKVNRKPVIVDYDDDLYAVPMSNPTFRIYNKPKAQNNVTTLIAKADIVTVSTQAIARKFEKILAGLAKAETRDPDWDLRPGKIHVLPNAYDTELLTKLEPGAPRKTPPRKVICWRGSGTHDADMWSVAEPFCKAFGKHLDWTVNLIGQPFWMFVDRMDKIPGIKPTSNVIVESLDPINYFEFLAQLQPALMIVPLEDIPFNHAKSNIAYLEGIHAGAVTLAPDWEEWRRPGVINYKDPEDFGAKLDAFMAGKFDAAKLWQDGRDFVAEHLTLGRVNRVRELLLKDVMERGQ